MTDERPREPAPQPPDDPGRIDPEIVVRTPDDPGRITSETAIKGGWPLPGESRDDTGD